MKTTNLSRRSFLQDAGATAAVVATAGMLAGCNANSSGSDVDVSAAGSSAAAYEPAESMDVDIVVVGAPGRRVSPPLFRRQNWAQLRCCWRKTPNAEAMAS